MFVRFRCSGCATVCVSEGGVCVLLRCVPRHVYAELDLSYSLCRLMMMILKHFRCCRLLCLFSLHLTSLLFIQANELNRLLRLMALCVCV